MPKKNAPTAPTKICGSCDRALPLDRFNAQSSARDGLQRWCRSCQHGDNAAKVDAHAEKVDRAIAERARRLASETEALRPEDLDDDAYDVGVGNVKGAAAKRLSAQASRERRQEFNARMGEHAADLASAARTAHERGGDVLAGMSPRSAEYIGKLAEQELRFGRRRVARTIALAQASEAANLAMMKQVAREFFSGKIEARGYAAKPSARRIKRSVVLLLSDLHFGAELSSLDEPVPFGAIQEARRLEYVVRQAIDYKPQYRADTELVLCLNGDVIEGLLGHQIAAGDPLAEQKAIFWRLMSQAIGMLARAFPRVRVFCQAGNHGRDKVRHPGRATWRKWDGHEFECYYALAMMSSSLKNVTFDVPFRAVSAIDLHGAVIGMTHGDTELPFGHPDTKAKQNAQAVDRVNALKTWGHWFDGWLVGHYHTGRYMLGQPRLIFNAALVPPNGHARGAGYIGDACGQFMFESVEGHPIGDVRFLEVSERTDADESLGKLIQPFRFPKE